MPSYPAEPTATLTRVSVQGLWPILGVGRFWAQFSSRMCSGSAWGAGGRVGTSELGTPCLPIPPPNEVPEVVQEWCTGLKGQVQGERPHQVIYLLLSCELLQCSKYPFLGSWLVPQDFIHL